VYTVDIHRRQFAHKSIFINIQQ